MNTGRVSISFQIRFIMSEFVLSSIRGFHVYSFLWRPKDNESLNTRRDIANAHDLYAVAVRKGQTVVGHIPKEFSHIAGFTLKWEGELNAK